MSAIHRTQQTFRLTLTSDQDPSLILFDRTGIPESIVRQIADALREVMPLVETARAGHQAYTGLRRLFEGVSDLAPARPHRRHQPAPSRGRR